MKNLGYYNGKFGLLEEMTVPMLDRVCYFGDGVYDATYSRNHKIYNLDAHINRFFNSAKLLEINIPHTKEEMKEILSENAVSSGERSFYVSDDPMQFASTAKLFLEHDITDRIEKTDIDRA